MAGEHGIGGIDVPALEEVAVHVAVGLEVADDGLDGRTPAQLLLDDAVNAALLARSVDPELGTLVAGAAMARVLTLR